ncbi:MAG: hypothetical protein BWY27_00766 [Bacteroidetes bacterium ADurb.Bin234]|nr:MAG: hypothetical protein BWY27_00766 [Bacteroidetes bacterium ADurb.Bin234]
MSEEQTLIYHTLLLSQIPLIGDITARKLIMECGSAEAVFKEKKQKLLRIDGIGDSVVNNLQHISSAVHEKVQQELDFIQKHGLNTYIITEDNYPKRLKHCVDAPIILFGKGNMEWNVPKVLAVVGTRKASSYGITFTKQLMEGLASVDVMLVSGLAYGIDTIAHESAVHHNLQTVGVLGHGLQMIYPASNRKLAGRMLKKGGLLTEYMHEIGPDAVNFPSRNRIIAGLSDAVIVVEARKEGGALITADLAFSYDRDVFAVPGRVGDAASEGCNNLIKQNKAALITSAKDVIDLMRWDDNQSKKKNRQEKLFFDVSEEEKNILEHIQQQDMIDIDSLSAKINIPVSRLSVLLLSLECKCYIECLPGKRYKLV